MAGTATPGVFARVRDHHGTYGLRRPKDCGHALWEWVAPPAPEDLTDGPMPGQLVRCLGCGIERTTTI